MKNNSTLGHAIAAIIARREGMTEADQVEVDADHDGRTPCELANDLRHGR